MDNGVYDVFVLEDSPERIKWFKMIFSDCNLIFTKDIQVACDELRTKDYDMIFLDRDLGYPRGESGEDVAFVMKEEQLAQNSCVIIHTINPCGRKIMKEYLESYHDNVNIINFFKLRRMKREDFG